MVEFKSKATIWVACNHKPEVDASDAAMWRRIRFIPFTRVFRQDEQDPELAEKLSDEADEHFELDHARACNVSGQGLAEPERVCMRRHFTEMRWTAYSVS